MNLLASMRYLVALSEHKHFGRAAAACHITQPALSNALRALESEFGVVIVKRARVYVGLTHEGERVLATAQRMLRDNEVLLQELRSEAGEPRGSLRMAAVPTAIPMLSRFAAMLHQRHPGIVPGVISMSSQELETGLESLSVDLALGYTERMHMPGIKLTAWPQSIEHYFLLRRAAVPSDDQLRIGKPLAWAEAAKLPLCLLTPDMHNRAIVDQALREAVGTVVAPAIETNSVLALVLAVIAGTVSSVLPGAMVAAVRSYRELEALPLVAPEVLTPIGFMTQDGVRASRALEAALAFLQTPEWLAQAALHSGTLGE
ncbi:DNA-binding transcriptional regulator, LysR family [Variovorax sp. PDC80]|jgi:DNA-binding transcriptional LysR family regulator|uniref:LysR family transcriptional regulator n=1 Tax=unclassified Variovorax TaxID=663243 RepID=UPI0008E1DA16|nr:MULTISPECIES: LysR substrate-binding domain-containing protein [unclassified Variovorax]KAF1072648.1 MAG: Hydrogen peroxide-inducible genes activator [Variovorax sp.]MCT8179332.1 LysR family transcriptional regulator [Variovorax sp. CY25R-8]SFO13867.1 DNA-binding transcriptional regulator, LysR family [Variovorax sp. PDC80]